MTAPRFEMTAQLQKSWLDARRGVVRLHPVVLDMLGMQPWDPVQLEGLRVTGALAAAAPYDSERSIVLMDDLTCVNAGVEPGGPVGVARGAVQSATSVTVSVTASSANASEPNPQVLRFALLGKVISTGDGVSLLPQDFARPAGEGRSEEVLGTLARSFGSNWQSVVLRVTQAEPAGLVRVTNRTEVRWDGSGTGALAGPLPADRPVPTVDELPGLETQIGSLREWLDLGFHRTELLGQLGARPQMGVLITGPPGSGKSSMVEAVAAVVGARVHRVWGPAVARLEPNAGARDLRAVFSQAATAPPAVVLVEDVEALAPRKDPGPLLSILLEEITRAITAGRVAVVCTTAHPEGTSPELRRPGVLDQELEIPLPQKPERRRILDVHTRRFPLASDVNLDEVAGRAAGFVAADLVALCREAALNAAQRVTSSGATDESPTVSAADFDAALDVVKPSTLDGVTLEIAEMHLDDVGDMEQVKKELTEAVLWPLRYPDTFSRLGIKPPRGVLLFGPPGCGKTFIVKAMANDAEANFLSVKGAELLSMWVGESERGVRELFRRARNAAPALVFFDEIDALVPQRGASAGDSGVSDRVVAQLLTELDGVEEMTGVFVMGATNRPDLVDPALLRPGRLERLIWVPPPDPEARAAILKSAARRIPLAPDVDLAALGQSCEGYSAADLDALAREAAMTAMREDMEAPQVTAAHFEEAHQRVRPSLSPEIVVALEQWAEAHARRA